MGGQWNLSAWSGLQVRKQYEVDFQNGKAERQYIAITMILLRGSVRDADR
jgi:hypothetical protein